MRPYIVKYLPLDEEEEPEEFIVTRRRTHSDASIETTPTKTEQPSIAFHHHLAATAAARTFQLYPASPPAIAPLKSPVKCKQDVFLDEQLGKSKRTIIPTVVPPTVGDGAPCSYFLQHVSKQTPPSGGKRLMNLILMPFRYCQTPLVTGDGEDWPQLQVFRDQPGATAERRPLTRIPPLSGKQGCRERLTTQESSEPDFTAGDSANDLSCSKSLHELNTEETLSPTAPTDGAGGSLDAIPLSEACVNVLNHSWAKEREWFFLKPPSTVVDDE